MSWRVAVTPTDTVYGIVCKVNDPEAYEKIYEIKERDQEKPLILFVDSIATAKKYFENWNDTIEDLAQKHWPGSLTIISKRSEQLPRHVNPGFKTIGIRIPQSKSVSKLLKQVPEKALLSTSANISGERPVIDYDTAVMKFTDQAGLILAPEANEMFSNIPSTIVSVEGSEVKILRQGATQI